MVKVLSFRLQQCFGTFNMLLVEGPFETEFLDIFLTTFSLVHKFKNTWAMRVIFFLKLVKIESKFRKWKKNLEIFFRFWDKCIWICFSKLPPLRRECLSSAVNGLTKSPKILHITKRDFFNPNCLHRDQ